MGSYDGPSNMNYNLPSDRLLLPECLSEDVLKQLLLSRGVLKENLPKERGGLIDLYNRLILPLDQRKYDLNTRIGKKLSQFENIEATKTKNIGNVQNFGAESRNTVNIKTKNHSRPANDLSKEPFTKKSRSTITWP